MINLMTWTPQRKEASIFQERIPLPKTAVLWKTKFPIPATTRSPQAANLSLASPPPFQIRRLSLLRSRRMRRTVQQRFRRRSRPPRLVQSPAGAEGDPQSAYLHLHQGNGAEEGRERPQMRRSMTGIQRILPMTAPPGFLEDVRVPKEKGNALLRDPPGRRTGTVVDL